jgi:hypothetical protein
VALDKKKKKEKKKIQRVTQPIAKHSYFILFFIPQHEAWFGEVMEMKRESYFYAQRMFPPPLPATS